MTLRSPHELRTEWSALWRSYQASILGVRFDKFNNIQMRAFQLSAIIQGFVYGFDGGRLNRPAEDVLLTADDLDWLAQTILDRLVDAGKPIVSGYVADELNAMGKEAVAAA